MKSGLYIITYTKSARDPGDQRIIVSKLLLKPDFTRRGWCDKILREWFIMWFMIYAALRKPNHRYRQILRATRVFVGDRSAETPRIGQQEEHDLLSRRPGRATFYHTHLCAPAKNYSSFLGMFCRTLHIVLTLLHRIIISSTFFKILLMKKVSQIRMPSKFTLSGFCKKNLKRSGRRGSLICKSNRWTKVIEQKDTYII